MAAGYNKHMEEVAEEVASRMAERMRVIEKALIPDGRPLFAEKKSDETRLREYLARRGNPQAQLDYMRGLVTKAQTALVDVGVDAASVHPWDVAINYTVAESEELERKLAERPDLLMEAMLAQQEAMMMQPPPMPEPMMPPMEMAPPMDPMMQAPPPMMG